MVFIYRSIQSVGPLKALYTFCPPLQTCSFRHQLGFSGKHSSHAAISATTKSRTCPPLYIARYSFIQRNQRGRQWRERKFQIFDTVAKQDSNLGSLYCEFSILPLSYRAPSLSLRTLITASSSHLLLVVLLVLSLLPRSLHHTTEIV